MSGFVPNCRNDFANALSFSHYCSQELSQLRAHHAMTMRRGKAHLEVKVRLLSFLVLQATHGRLGTDGTYALLTIRSAGPDLYG